MRPAPKMPIDWALVTSCPFSTTSFRASKVIDQNKNKDENEEHRTETIFTQKATWVTSDPASIENNRPTNKKKGAPGGCGTISL